MQRSVVENNRDIHEAVSLSLNTIAGGKQHSDVKCMSYKSDSFVIICDVIHIKNI